MAQSVVTWKGEVRRARRVSPLVLVVILGVLFLWLRPTSDSASWQEFIASSIVAGVVVALVALAVRPRFFCPGCNKHIATSMEWVCGYCDSPNGGLFRTFLDSCSTCGRAPAIVICPHPHRSGGGEIEVFPITLMETDEATPHPARKLTPQQPGETIEQAKARWVRERQLVEAEMLAAGAAAKRSLASAKRQDIGAERELQQAMRVPRSATAEVEEKGKRILDGVLAQFKGIATEMPAVHRAYEAACREIDQMPGLSEAAKEQIKGKLMVDLEEKLNAL